MSATGGCIVKAGSQGLVGFPLLWVWYIEVRSPLCPQLLWIDQVREEAGTACAPAVALLSSLPDIPETAGNFRGATIAFFILCQQQLQLVINYHFSQVTFQTLHRLLCLSLLSLCQMLFFWN